MPDAFVSMREWLEPPVPSVEEDRRSQEDAEPAVDEPDECPEDAVAAIAAARRFRAAVADAVDACVDELLVDIAAEVLGRELQLAPCNVRRIVDRALERYDASPVAIRVHPDDASALPDWKVVEDPTLRSGDAVLELRAGAIAATLGVRLARVLAIERR